MPDRSVAVLESSLALRPSSALPPLPTIDVGAHEERCGRLLAGLGLELGALRDRKVVDVHGMGSLALGAALAGAQVWSIPLDEARGEWTARWFQRQRKTLRLTTDLDVVREADLVVFADGDAPMHDPIARLPRVLGALRSEAHAVVFVPERHARLRSILRLRVLAQIAHGRDELVRAAGRLFPRFVAACAHADARGSHGLAVLDRVTGPLPLLPTRAEVVAAVGAAGCDVVAVDPSAGLSAGDARLDAIWSTWPQASEAAAAELAELERRIASRDYDEQHLRMLDAPDELDRVAFAVRRAH
ncbi:MAG: hypothetical protein JNL94_04890 [Planctomycetes bacterium]|nr:hypothetical protein [Planctomycetota bacterium]